MSLYERFFLVNQHKALIWPDFVYCRDFENIVYISLFKPILYHLNPSSEQEY